MSNGFNRFQLTIAAAEAARHGWLAQLITGAYPTAAVASMARLLPHSPQAARLLKRAEAVPADLVTSIWLPELMYRGGRVGRGIAPPLTEACTERSFRWYGVRAGQVLKRIDADIYHYRAGFGGASVARARRQGMRTICDHSIAHPAALEYMVDNGGKLPDAIVAPQTPVWRYVQEDIEQADLVLVNSEFVKQTFVNQGADPDAIRVLYWGVDEGFVELIPERETGKRPDGLRLLFAGTLEDRKGAHVLEAGLLSLDDVPWTLRIAGSTEAAGSAARLLADSRVSALGTLRRDELARELTCADIFVFPTLAEGSARVVFEALAAGCFVITTPNAGSVVEDGVNGTLIPPGEGDALADAIRQASRRNDFGEIARRDAPLVASRYSQRAYGEGLIRVYEEALG